MRGLVALLVFLPLGCGRADYERRAAQTRERLQYVDEENDLLAAPLQGLHQPLLFFRPPLEVDAKPRPSGAGEWLLSYPGSESPGFLAILDVHVGAVRKALRRDELDAEIAKALRARVAKLRSLPDAGKELVCERACEPAGQRRSVKYRRLVFEGEAHVNGAQQLPATARRLDAYVHEAGEWWVVIVFDHLDRGGTEQRWRRDAKFDPGWLRRLPPLDDARLARQKTRALATLRVGPEAEALWQYYASAELAR